MKDLDQAPEQVAQEIVAPVKTEKKRLVSRPLKPGMTQWEFNLDTHVGTPVQFKFTETVKTDLGIMLRHHIEYRKDRYYCTAINYKNALRKYQKWFTLNQRVKMLMASAPQPTSE